MRRRAFLVPLTMIALAGQVHATGWPVVDVAAIAQSFQNTIQTAAVVANTAKSVTNEYNIILQQIRQYESMVTNLRRIPEGLNFFQTMTELGNRVTELLGTARIVSYDLNNASRQFDQLYQQVGTLHSPADILAWRQQLLAGRMEASSMTIQVTAIKTQLTDLYSRICALLNGSWLANGNLDSQQIAAQQQGLSQHTMETVAAIHAAHARNTAQYLAEQAAMERLQIEAIQGAMGNAAPFTTPQGAFARYHW